MAAEATVDGHADAVSVAPERPVKDELRGGENPIPELCGVYVDRVAETPAELRVTFVTSDWDILPGDMLHLSDLVVANLGLKLDPSTTLHCAVIAPRTRERIVRECKRSDQSAADVKGDDPPDEALWTQSIHSTTAAAVLEHATPQ
jgi:hypothetical protein